MCDPKRTKVNQGYYSRVWSIKKMSDLIKEAGNIVSQLEANVLLNPNKTALVCGDSSITYQEFSAQVEKLAGYIAQNAQEKPVALLLNRSINTMVAIYAALSANVAYLPIDPANPKERINYLLQDSEAQLLITEQDYEQFSAHFNGTFAIINQLLAADSTQGANLVKAAEIDSNSPAYIIYTSGSTGTPKGVLCSHQNLSYTNKVMLEQFELLGVDDQSSWLWNASYAFDASIKGVVALAQGKTVVVPSDEDVKDPKALCALIQKQNINVVNTPPILMEYLLPHLSSTQTHVHIIVSGDDVSKSLWSKLYDYSSSCSRKVINAYGPTEASVNASFDVQTNAEQVTIGGAVVGAQLYVLDSKGQQVAQGEEGELYISGEGLALGYLNRDDVTKAAFVEILASKTQAYKTGDMVKVLSDGKLQFTGRIDNQVKYRGYRIELDEIQTILKQHELIADAAVITNKIGEDLKIEAYLVAGSSQPTEQDLEVFLNDALPEYMHPTKLSFVSEIPLTSGGKIDKASLQGANVKPDTQVGSNSADIESRLSAIWLDVLTLDEVSPEDNFFKRGGHSLLAMQLIQKVDAEFGVELDIRQLFSLLTLQSQIDWLKEHLAEVEIEFSQPENDVESKLKDIWKGLLDKEEINGEDNFFKLGGHSLLAMNLLAQMKDEFGVEMDIRELFAHLEFNAQLQWIENAMSTNAADSSADEADDKVELEL